MGECRLSPRSRADGHGGLPRLAHVRVEGSRRRPARRRRRPCRTWGGAEGAGSTATSPPPAMSRLAAVALEAAHGAPASLADLGRCWATSWRAGGNRRGVGATATALAQSCSEHRRPRRHLDWGWEELARIERGRRRSGERILRGRVRGGARDTGPPGAGRHGGGRLRRGCGDHRRDTTADARSSTSPSAPGWGDRHPYRGQRGAP